jgi:aryl-alcohol dehydrogenase-like predicted oxidoreductase
MKLALGTVQFGLDYGVANSSGRISDENAEAVLKRAYDAGMDTVDTAIAYGNSEELLGKLGVHSWKVITKLPSVPNDCSNVNKWVREQVRGSIQRLGVKTLYGLLLHDAGQLLNDVIGPKLYAALQSLKDDGFAEKIGVSVYRPDILSSIFERFKLDLVQAPLNILDRRLITSGWAERLNAAGVEVHTRSAFLQGLLIMPRHSRPAKFDRWSEIWREWDRWLSSSGLSPIQACIRYSNSFPTIDRVVVGVDSVDQLAELIEAGNDSLTQLPDFCHLQDDRLINPTTWDEI